MAGTFTDTFGTGPKVYIGARSDVGTAMNTAPCWTGKKEVKVALSCCLHRYVLSIWFLASRWTRFFFRLQLRTIRSMIARNNIAKIFFIVLQNAHHLNWKSCNLSCGD